MSIKTPPGHHHLTRRWPLPSEINLSHLPPITQATSAAIGSVISSAIVYPLDLITTRMQTRRLRRTKHHQRPTPSRLSSLASEFSTISTISSIKRSKDYSTLIGSFKAIIQVELSDRSKMINSVVKFYDGIFIDSIATFINSFVYFYVYTNLNRLNVRRKKLARRRIGWFESIVEEILLGSLAGIISKFFTCPLNNITVRLQADPSSFSRRAPRLSSHSDSKPTSETIDHRLMPVFKYYNRPDHPENHPRLPSTISKTGHVPIIDSSSSEDEDEEEEESRTQNSFISTIVNPVKSIYHQRGYRGFWSGFGNNCILTLHPSLTLYLTKILKHLITIRSSSRSNGKHDRTPGPADPDPNDRLSITFLNSAIASSLSTIIIYPLMLSKTLIQTQTQHATQTSGDQSALATYSRRQADLLIRYKYYGFKSLYTGLQAKLLKVFIGQGITMTIKKQIETILISLWIFFKHHQHH